MPPGSWWGSVIVGTVVVRLGVLTASVCVDGGVGRCFSCLAVGTVDALLRRADRGPDLAGGQSGHLGQVGLGNAEVLQLDQRLPQGSFGICAGVDRREHRHELGLALSRPLELETVDPYPLDVQLKSSASAADRETWRVSKIKWGKKKDPETGKNVDDRTTIVYSPKVTIARIPEEAERYMLGSRSALAWIIDRYQVKTDKASGIVNDPNDWCDEHDDPTYIVDLIKRVTTVAVETMKIVDAIRCED